MALTRSPLQFQKKKRRKSGASWEITADHLVVGMVANFNRSVKGVSRFLDAVPKIAREVPSARFLLLGRGKEEKALREKARALGVE